MLGYLEEGAEPVALVMHTEGATRYGPFDDVEVSR